MSFVRNRGGNKAAMAACVLLLLSSLSSCSKGGSGVGEDGEGDGRLVDENLALEQNRWAEDGSIPKAMADGLFDDIHFGFESSVVAVEDREKIRKNAQTLQQDPSFRVEVEGHCDKRGTNEYNYALGEQRANSVASLLVSYGALESQVATVSYGEEIPLDPADDEDAYSKNRRVHFAVYRAKETKPSAAKSNKK